MKILVLGGSGMAGHVIAGYLKQVGHDIMYTVRKEDPEGIRLDVRNLESVRNLILKEKPEILINGVGLLNDYAEKHVMDAIKVNSLLPHVLTEILDEYGGKLIHISTDCVFSGEKGGYMEQSERDGITVYSKSKALGEVDRPPHLTVRTSIIGPELKEDGIGLLGWFLKQSGSINGYENVYWNGVTTLELAKAINHFIRDGVTGLYHLCANEKISKFELLKLFQEIFNTKTSKVVPVKEPAHDRTLIHTRKDYSYRVKGYRDMLEELNEWMEG
jgi:dTDP-4-dehydrorhamnose reductase